MLNPTRITDARAAAVNSIFVEYSSVCPFNQDNTRLLLQQSNGFIRLHDGDGKFIKTLPHPVISGSEPRWSRTDPTALYYVRGNQLFLYRTEANDPHILQTEFAEYTKISGKGESDISEDGDHLVFVGDNREVFVYQISQNRKHTTFLAPLGLNSLYITPDNNVLCGTSTGVLMYDSDGNFLRKVAQTQSHMDVMRDSNGDEVLIRTNAADNPNLAGCNNGVEKVRLADGLATCIWPLGWDPRGGPYSLAVHISCPDRGFALVSTYNSRGHQPSQVFKLPLDGTPAELLSNTGTSASSYNSQPKASVSRDGSRFVFNSDADGVVDTWLVEMQAEPAPTPVSNFPGAGWKEINFTPDEGREWVWHFRVIDGKMTVKVYDKQ